MRKAGKSVKSIFGQTQGRREGGGGGGGGRAGGAADPGARR